MSRVAVPFGGRRRFVGPDRGSVTRPAGGMAARLLRVEDPRWSLAIPEGQNFRGG